MSRTLPQDFAELEPFAARWAIAESAQRAALRTASSAEEKEAFFAAAAPHLDRALDYLDGRPPFLLGPQEERLMNLMLTLAHVALAVEIQGPCEGRGAVWRARMQITHSPADSPLPHSPAL